MVQRIYTQYKSINYHNSVVKCHNKFNYKVCTDSKVITMMPYGYTREQFDITTVSASSK